MPSLIGRTNRAMQPTPNPDSDAPNEPRLQTGGGPKPFQGVTKYPLFMPLLPSLPLKLQRFRTSRHGPSWPPTAKAAFETAALFDHFNAILFFLFIVEALCLLADWPIRQDNTLVRFVCLWRCGCFFSRFLLQCFLTLQGSISAIIYASSNLVALVNVR